MGNVFFKPWIGNNYWNSGWNGKKILVIGNSHYCGNRKSCKNCGVDGNYFDYDVCSDFTIDVINDYLTPNSNWQKWMATYQKFERALCGYYTNDNDSYDIWNSIAFYNYLQTAVTSPYDPGKNKDYYASETAFWEVLERLYPDCIIMWGSRVWNKASSFNGEGDSYVLDDGTEIPVLGNTSS